MRTRSATRPPGRPKQSDNMATSDNVLRVAAHHFMDGGYEAVSIESIADAVGVTKASIYYYFPNKADLFVSAIESLLMIILRESRRILDGPQPFETRLLILTEVRLRVAETRFDFDRIIREAEPHLNADQNDRLRSAMDNMAHLVVGTFERAMDAGEIRTADARFAAHAYFALLNVAFARDRQGERLFPDARSTAEALVRLMMSGLMSPELPGDDA